MRLRDDETSFLRVQDHKEAYLKMTEEQKDRFDDFREAKLLDASAADAVRCSSFVPSLVLVLVRSCRFPPPGSSSSSLRS